MAEVTAVIIDDESHCIGSLEILIGEHTPAVRLLGSARSAADGMDLVQRARPDLVFLDIAMPRKNGFEMLEEIDERNFEVIFTTAYNQYAIEAFKVNAADYLMKPVEPPELIRAVKRVVSRMESMRPPRKDEKREWEKLLESLKASALEPTIALPTFAGIEVIGVNKILFVEADSNYSRLCLEHEKQLIVSKTLKDMAFILEEFGFLRVHHSFLVNIRKVRRYIKGDGGYLVMENGREVSVSRRRKDSLIHALNVK